MSNDPRDQTPRTQRTTTTTTTRTGARGTTVRQRSVTRPSRVSPQLIGLALLALIVLVMILFGRPMLRWLGFGASEAAQESETAVAVRPTPGLGIGAESVRPAGSQPTQVTVIDLAPPSGPSPTFSAFYEQRGGLRVLGLPLSNEITVGGRRIQWFERARLEYWPEHQGTPYEVQLGRLGAEIMQGRSFPKPAPFVSQPGLLYFPETGYAVGEPFLSFWAQNGGLDTFGYPISTAVPEQLSDGQVHTVQYFERARLELHPEDPGNEVQLGLLGRALFARDRTLGTVPTPHIVAAPGPTDVPLP